MQVKHFESGGFVIHAIVLKESKMTFSCWYDDRGQLLDIEAFNSYLRPNRGYTVKRATGPVGEKLKLLGFQNAKRKEG